MLCPIAIPNQTEPSASRLVLPGLPPSLASFVSSLFSFLYSLLLYSFSFPSCFLIFLCHVWHFSFFPSSYMVFCLNLRGGRSEKHCFAFELHCCSWQQTSAHFPSQWRSRRKHHWLLLNTCQDRMSLDTSQYTVGSIHIMQHRLDLNPWYLPPTVNFNFPIILGVPHFPLFAIMPQEGQHPMLSFTSIMLKPPFTTSRMLISSNYYILILDI